MKDTTISDISVAGKVKSSSSSVGETEKAGYTVTVRVQVVKGARLLDEIMELVEAAGGTIGSVTPVRNKHGEQETHNLRDIRFTVTDSEHGEQVIAQMKQLQNVEVVAASDRTFLMHLGGKITISPCSEIKTDDTLSMIYTPGVARVCTAIYKDPSKARSLTIKGKSVAVITDGSRVLGLGNIGPLASLPVMEGKAALFKRFGNVDAFPLPLATQDTEEIIRTIKAVAPVFGAINLEDIASPRCYEIEERLKHELDIPVFHDDQHGTAVVVAAATKNAARLTKKRLSTMKVVVVGVGAAGMACAELILALGVKNLIGFNIKGAVHRDRTDLTAQEAQFAQKSNPRNFKGTIEEALVGADMVLGLSIGGSIKPVWLAKMKKNAICFALANPVPEVLPKDAKPYVAVMATGGSNYPNQINNALVFPGIFRGALDAEVSDISYEMQLEAAHALAGVVSKAELDYDKIIPSVFDETAHAAVAEAVRRVAKRNKLGRYREEQ